MNLTENKEQEFEILGCKIKFSKTESSNFNAENVVNMVKEEIESILASRPHLEKTEAAVLVALKLASDKITLDSDYRENLSMIQSSAKDALNLIEGIKPNLQ